MGKFAYVIISYPTGCQLPSQYKFCTPLYLLYICVVPDDVRLDVSTCLIDLLFLVTILLRHISVTSTFNMKMAQRRGIQILLKCFFNSFVFILTLSSHLVYCFCWATVCDCTVCGFRMLLRAGLPMVLVHLPTMLVGVATKNAQLLFDRCYKKWANLRIGISLCLEISQIVTHEDFWTSRAFAADQINILIKLNQVGCGNLFTTQAKQVIK